MNQTAAARRVRFGAMTTVLLAAATVSLILVNLLASRYSRAWDVTATREQELSPRTRRLLADLADPYEVVVAADSRTLDRGARDRVGDVLAQFERGSRAVRVTTIDTASPGGVEEYERLLARLRERDAPRIRERAEAVGRAIDGAEDLASRLEELSPRLLAVRDALTPGEPAPDKARKGFETRAAEARISAQGLRDLARKARVALGADAGPLGVPDTEEAGGPLRQALADLELGLRTFAEDLRQFASGEAMPPQARDAAAPLAAAVGRMRDAAARLADSLRPRPLDIARVAKVLRTAEAALVIGPPDAGLTAIPFTWLFPSTDALDAADGARADLRRKSEELFAAAIESLARPVNPIVVLLHGSPGRGFARSPEYQTLIQRLNLRGIDLVEWASVLESEPPNLTTLDPTRRRPVVYVVLNTDTTTGGSAPGQTGPERAAALGRAIRRVVDDGAPLLLSVIPSELPTYGEKDPTVAELPLFGLESDSARPLLREQTTPRGRAVGIDQTLVCADGKGPIQGAVRNLRTLFEWATPLRPIDGWADGTIQALYTVNDPATWGESQWKELWSAVQAQRGPPPNLPSRDSARDDANGPWTIAAAATRHSPRTGREQRLVAIGANGWFRDGVTTAQAAAVDGKPAPAFPGNAELLEASVYWLAGQDDRIAQSPTARAVPVIGPLDPGTRSGLRWLVLAGLPGLTLAAGILWRAVRG
jgi:hypothetical protein